MTKREIITAMLTEATIQANVDYVNYLQHELELLDRKNTSRKPTKEQVENARIKDVIMDTLAQFTEPVRIATIQEQNSELGELSNQRISALLKQLVDNSQVEKSIVKKIAYFSIK